MIVLIETGLRSNDALQLPADPVVMLPDGSPVLRFINHKRNREAAIPISDRLLERIRYQQAHSARAFPNGSPWLLPAIGPCNGQGLSPYSPATLRDRLRAWLAEMQLVDAHALPVAVTAHQFRHTLGTRMINRDVPLEVIRRMLDHGSLQMTEVYSRLSDAKLREHFDNFHERINRRGEKVTLTTGGVLGEAAWTKERLARARQALPERILRPAAAAALPAPERVPELRELPHRSDVPGPASRASRAGRGATREGHRERLAADRREQRERPRQPDQHHRWARTPRDRNASDDRAA